MNEHFNINSAEAFFFLFFLHENSIGNGQQGISYNGKILAKAGIRGTTAEFRTKV